MRVVINVCFGGFGLSDEAYEELIKLGIPVRKYEQQVRGKNGLFNSPKNNEGKIIFDRELTPQGESRSNDFYWENRKDSSGLHDRYWETWLYDDRTNPLLIQVLEKMGKKANSRFAELKIVEIPDGTEYTVEEYDGREHIAETHRTWR